MEFSKDEVRRELRTGQRDHQAAMPSFANALDTAFVANSAATADSDKSGLLGLPDRRGFLKIGGLSVAMSALLISCVNPDKEKVQVQQTGTLPPTPPTTLVPPNPGSADTDAVLVLTALSIERLAIDTYQAALDAGWLQVALLQDVAKYFQSQHKDHAGVLASTAKKMGQDPDKVAANPYLLTKVVEPATKLISSETGTPEVAQTDTLKLAINLEDAAAQTYTKAGGILTTAALRQAIMSIGAIEARHYSVLAGVLGNPPVPFPFEHISAAAPPDSYIALNVQVPSSPSTSATSGTAGAKSSTTTTSR